MDTRPREGVVKEDKSFHTVGNPLTGVSVGSFEISEGNITWRKKKKTHKICTEAQPLVKSEKWGLGREAQAASSVLRLRTRPKCPEDYLRKLI